MNENVLTVSDVTETCSGSSYVVTWTIENSSRTCEISTPTLTCKTVTEIVCVFF